MINICNGKMEGLVTLGKKIQMTYIYRDEDIFKPFCYMYKKKNMNPIFYGKMINKTTIRMTTNKN